MHGWDRTRESSSSIKHHDHDMKTEEKEDGANSSCYGGPLWFQKGTAWLKTDQGRPNASGREGNILNRSPFRSVLKERLYKLLQPPDNSLSRWVNSPGRPGNDFLAAKREPEFNSMWRWNWARFYVAEYLNNRKKNTTGRRKLKNSSEVMTFIRWMRRAVNGSLRHCDWLADWGASRSKIRYC